MLGTQALQLIVPSFKAAVSAKLNSTRPTAKFSPTLLLSLNRTPTPKFKTRESATRDKALKLLQNSLKLNMDSEEFNHFQTEEPLVSLTERVYLNSAASRSLGCQDFESPSA